MSEEIVYKLVGADEWAHAMHAGRFVGAGIDLVDGYVHLSTGAQVAETARRHFAGRDDLVLVALDPAVLGAALRWEPSRQGALFPHLYGVVEPAAVVWSAPLELPPTPAGELVAEAVGAVLRAGGS